MDCNKLSVSGQAPQKHILRWDLCKSDLLGDVSKKKTQGAREWGLEGRPPSKGLCGVKCGGKRPTPRASSAERGRPSEPALRTRSLSSVCITPVRPWPVLWEAAGGAQSSGTQFTEWAPSEISERKEPGIKTSFNCQRESLKAVMENRSPTFPHTLSNHQAVPSEENPLPQI